MFLRLKLEMNHIKKTKKLKNIQKEYFFTKTCNLELMLLYYICDCLFGGLVTNHIISNKNNFKLKLCSRLMSKRVSRIIAVFFAAFVIGL